MAELLCTGGCLQEKKIITSTFFGKKKKFFFFIKDLLLLSCLTVSELLCPGRVMPVPAPPSWHLPACGLVGMVAESVFYGRQRTCAVCVSAPILPVP